MKQYFDDREGDALSRETTHPNFVQALTEQFYYDCTDEFSPFGNDEGADTLYALEDWYRENGRLDKPMLFLKELIEDNFGVDMSHIGLEDKDEIISINQNEEFLFDILDRSVIATSFGQYKIEGRIDIELRRLGLLAIRRQTLLTEYKLAHSDLDLGKLLKIVDLKTTNLDEGGKMNHLYTEYLERLTLMGKDLERLE
jgi:uncharacterized protein YfeS